MKLIKLDRFFAWALFLSMLLFFVSGYGMTKGIITNSLAIDIHNKILPPIATISFTVHAWYAIHLAFKRWQFWNVFSMIFLTAFFLAFVGYFGYLQYFYQEKSEATPTPSNNLPNPTTTTTESKTFTLSELSKYNGKNGQPAYIAVNGNIYDVSSLFINGTHRGCTAGTDATANFSDVHSASILSQFTIVGTLTK